ncbi:MAG TPA: hypothetical protein VFO40_01525 [Chthoniobacterales bacterium]|nr:hypothetical protein [Chthoniobacterales bacterium]
MSDPLPAPSFNLKYDVPLTDIGKGYAEGITKMGESLAGTISGLLGGIDPKTGEIRQGIFGQNQTANETLQQLTQMKDPQGNPILSEEAYNSIMSKGLGTKQQFMGAYLSQILENQKQQAQQARELAVVQAQTRGSLAKTVLEGRLKAEEKTEKEPVLKLVPPKTEVKTDNVPPTQSAEEVEKALQKRFFFNPSTGSYEQKIIKTGV